MKTMAIDDAIPAVLLILSNSSRLAWAWTRQLQADERLKGCCEERPNGSSSRHLRSPTLLLVADYKEEYLVRNGQL